MSGDEFQIFVWFVQSQLSEWRLDKDALLQIVPVRDSVVRLIPSLLNEADDMADLALAEIDFIANQDRRATPVVHKNTSGLDHPRHGDWTVIAVAAPAQIP